MKTECTNGVCRCLAGSNCHRFYVQLLPNGSIHTPPPKDVLEYSPKWREKDASVASTSWIRCKDLICTLAWSTTIACTNNTLIPPKPMLPKLPWVGLPRKWQRVGSLNSSSPTDIRTTKNKEKQNKNDPNRAQTLQWAKDVYF